MDDTTASLLARYQRQMQKVNWLYDSAEVKLTATERVEQAAGRPGSSEVAADETTRALEAQLLRQQADALTKEPVAMQRAMVPKPTDELTRQIDDWVAGRNSSHDRDEREC